MKSSVSYEIDIVILWVDGNDPQWIEQRNKYSPTKDQDANKSRYRDWEFLKYLFRGIERYAPWVRKVHFVTCGQKPKWLNENCSKLNMVVHEDIIPKKYLPTFSSRAIDLNLHKIPDLSEHFIYFNDDMLLTKSVTPNDFFMNGLPRDMFSERPICHSGNVFAHNLLNDVEELSHFYSRKDVLKKQWKKVLYPGYGLVFFYNLLWFFLPYKKFSCLYICHLPLGYRKSTWERIWRLIPEKMEATVANKFRTITDLNQFIFEYDALMRGEFYPTNMKRQGAYFNVINSDVDNICESILRQRHKRICINDNCSQEVFEKVKPQILDCLEQILPDKCMFENK